MFYDFYTILKVSTEADDTLLEKETVIVKQKNKYQNEDETDEEDDKEKLKGMDVHMGGITNLFSFITI